MLQDNAQSVADMLNYGWCVLERRQHLETKTSGYTIIETNQAFRDMTGTEAVSGSVIADALPAMYTEIESGLAEVQRTGTALHFGITLARRWFEMHVSPFNHPGEERYALILKAINSSRERLIPALNIGLAGAFYWDIRRDCINLDENIAHYLAVSRAVLTKGLPLRKLLPAITDEDRMDVYRSLMRAMRTSDIYQSEFRIRVPHIGIRWISARAAVKRDERGMPIELSGFAMDISEKKAAAHALREREEQLRLALDVSGMGTMVWDIPNNRAELDPRIAALWGLPSEELDLPLESVIAAVHPDDRVALSKATEDAVHPKGSGAFSLDIRTVRPDGSVHWLALFGKVSFRDQRRSRPRILILATDITERKQKTRHLAFLAAIQDEFASASSAEEIMEAVGTQTGSFLDVPLFFIIEVDEQRNKKRILYPWGATDPWGVDLTARLPELLAGDFTMAFPPTESTVIHDTETETSTKSANFRNIGIRAAMDAPLYQHNGWSGALVVCDFRPRQWRDDEVGALQQLAEKVSPLLGRRRDQEVLRESEENYRAIVDQSIAGILKVDFSGRVTFSNERFADMLGYLLPEMTGLTIAHIVHPDDRHRNMALFHQLVNEGKAYDLEKRLLRKDGSYIWVNNQVSPLFDDQGNPHSAVIVSVDITKQKAAEKLKDDFIAVASHELRTPLTTIKAYGQLIEASVRQKKEALIGQQVTKLNSQIDRMASLVYSLLDSALLSGGILFLKKERFDMNELIEQCLEQFRSSNLAHELRFKPCDLQPVTADRARIGQVLVNLISNAMKYSPAGSRVTITCERDDAMCKVRVADSGIGIDSEYLDNIFQRFFRVADSSDIPISGFGLGLHIAAEIIRRHGGVIGVESVLGQGSIFHFQIPFLPSGAE